METYILTFRSLTYAQRAARVLQASGIHPILIRTPQGLSREGCGYALRVRSDRLSGALEALSAAGLPPKRVFRARPGGRFEEVAT